MDRSELLQALRDIVSRSVSNEINDIDESKNLRDDLGLDSIDLVSIVIEIQSTFDVELKNEELVKLVTVKDLLDLIAAKLAAKSATTANAGNKDAPDGEHRAA